MSYAIRREASKKLEDAVEQLFQEIFPDKSFSGHFRESVRGFIQKLPFDDVYQAMHKSIGMIHCPNQATKYFCGICWNKIRDIENA